MRKRKRPLPPPQLLKRSDDLIGEVCETAKGAVVLLSRGGKHNAP